MAAHLLGVTCPQLESSHSSRRPNGWTRFPRVSTDIDPATVSKRGLPFCLSKYHSSITKLCVIFQAYCREEQRMENRTLGPNNRSQAAKSARRNQRRLNCTASHPSCSQTLFPVSDFIISYIIIRYMISFYPY